jgi:hypothetical protein
VTGVLTETRRPRCESWRETVAQQAEPRFVLVRSASAEFVVDLRPAQCQWSVPVPGHSVALPECVAGLFRVGVLEQRVVDRDLHPDVSRRSVLKEHVARAVDVLGDGQREQHLPVSEPKGITRLDGRRIASSDLRPGCDRFRGQPRDRVDETAVSSSALVDHGVPHLPQDRELLERERVDACPARCLQRIVLPSGSRLAGASTCDESSVGSHRETRLHVVLVQGECVGDAHGSQMHVSLREDVTGRFRRQVEAADVQHVRVDLGEQPLRAAVQLQEVVGELRSREQPHQRVARFDPQCLVLAVHTEADHSAAN